MSVHTLSEMGNYIEKTSMHCLQTKVISKLALFVMLETAETKEEKNVRHENDITLHKKTCDG